MTDKLVETQSNNHIPGIECNCRLDNRAHEINTRSVLNNLWTRQKLLEETVQILQDIPNNKLSTEAFGNLLERIEELERMQQVHIERNLEDLQRINKLEELSKERAHLINYKSYLALAERIEKLESNQIGQALDPQVWKFVSERLDKLESLSDFKKLEACVLDGAQTHLSVLKIENRLKELEEWTRKDEDRVHDKLKKLEEMQRAMIEMPNVVWAKYNKTPHKCPVCEGTCMRPNPLRGLNNAEMLVNLDCIACEGAGILWA